MKFMYFFDDKIKSHIMKGKKYCNPAETGKYESGISCIRQNDVNLWFYTKNDKTIAIDAGHLNFQGIDVCGTNIYPNAQVYLGKEEVAYLNKTTHRMVKLGVKIKNCVQIVDKYYSIDNDETFDVEGIKVQAIHTPGHTLGHTCYVIDDKVLFTGDCLAINDNGGYSFFDFFTQYPDRNKKSLMRLKKLMDEIQPEYVCTGHSGMRKYSESIFAHINESAQFSRKKPFDDKAPYDAFNE